MPGFVAAVLLLLPTVHMTHAVVVLIIRGLLPGCLARLFPVGSQITRFVSVSAKQRP